MTLSLLNQTVTIGGDPYRVSNCLIDHALNGVPAISFDVELDANPGRPAPSLGDSVVVTQNSVTYEAEVSGIEAIRARNYNIFRLRCLGSARKLGLTRLLRVIPAGPVGTAIRNVASNVPGLDVSGVPLGGPHLPQTSLTYGSVAEFMAWAERESGWQWSVNNNVLTAFDPTDLQARPAKVLTTNDWELGSVNFTASMDVVNVARQQAWFHRTFRLSPELNLLARCFHSIPVPPGIPLAQDGWELLEAKLVQGHSIDNVPPFWPPLLRVGEEPPEPWTDQSDEIDIRVGPDMIEFIPALYWTPTPIVELTYRRLVWVQQTDTASIAAYGRREGPPLPHDGDITHSDAFSHLRAYLDRYSQPLIGLTGICLRDDIVPGDVIRTAVEGIDADRNYLVRRIRRATQGTELELRIEAESIGLVADPNVAPVARTSISSKQEFLRRIENLERGPLNPQTISGELAMDVGDLGPPVPVVTPVIRWNVAVEAISLPILETLAAPWGWEAETTYVVTGVKPVAAPWRWNAETEAEVTLVSTRFIEAPFNWTVSVQGEAVTHVTIEAAWGWSASVEREVEITAVVQTPWSWQAQSDRSSLILRQIEAVWTWAAEGDETTSVEPEVEVTWPVWTAETTAVEPPTETVAVPWPLWTAEVTGIDLGNADLEAAWPRWAATTKAEIGLGLTVDPQDASI